MQALIFDTETTGLINNHTISLDKQPHMIEFCGQLVDLTNGEVLEIYDTLVKPSVPVDLSKPVKGRLSIADITGITNEMIADAKAFKDVAADIVALVGRAPTVIAHNLAFNMEMVSIELERLGIQLRFPPGFCTVEQTMQVRGYRLTLTKLYDHLFPGETFEAHRAMNDVKALTRCCVEMSKRGML